MSKTTNVTGLPQPIVSAVMAHPHRPFKPCARSVTELLQPPQQRYLMELHWDDLVEDAADRIWALMGTAIHKVLEQAEQTGISEKGLSQWYDLPGVGKVQLTGTPDRLAIVSEGLDPTYPPSSRKRTKRYTLQDYKVASVWEFIMGVADEKKWQLRMYDHLLLELGYQIDRAELVFIFRDWKKREAKQELQRLNSFERHNRPAPKYPLTQCVKIPVARWSREEYMGFISVRFTDQMNPVPRPCTKEERWAKDDVYAVKKKGNKSAERGGLHPTHDQAEAFIKARASAKGAKLKETDFVIEFRQGESTRCEDYCAVRDFCPQYKRMKGISDA